MGASLSEWKKKFWTERESKTSVSDYWLRDSLFERSHSRLDYTDDNWDDENNRPIRVSTSLDHFALAKYQRAISNFVYILTQDNKISVRFNSASKNYATGDKVIQLSPDLKSGKFDVAVGLALHEASHILHTNFKAFSLWAHTAGNDILRRSPDCGLYGINPFELVKFIFNIIEDRYIDARTYREAPGYRGYYSALYIEYFGNELIDRGFYDPNFMTPTVDNYLFHLANMANPNRNIKALPGLDKIITLIDLPNILRLKNTKARTEIAQLVVDIIIGEIMRNTQPQQTNGDGSGNPNDGEPNKGGVPSSTGVSPTDSPEVQEQIKNALKEMLQKMDNQLAESLGQSTDGGEDSDDTDGDGGEDSDEGSEEDTGDDGGDNDSEGDGDEGGEEDGDGDDEEDTPDVKDTPAPLIDRSVKKLREIIETQKELISGDLRKGKVLNEDDARLIDDITNAGVEIASVSDTALNIKNEQVYVVNNVSKSIVGTEFGRTIGLQSKANLSYQVESGIAKGRLLANKLHLRAEERTLTTTRQKSGRLDKRLLAEIGFDNYDVFSRINLETYNESYIHISLDQSGSMHGGKWRRTVEIATVLATAATLIPNIRVVVTTRSSLKTKYGSNSKNFIATVFDSKKHNVSHIRAVFPHLETTGNTPEGLCFAAILKDIIANSANTDAYFINICDGMPSYTNGEKHTQAQREILEKHGVRILAYYIDDHGYYGYSGDKKPNATFMKMYGEKNSYRIDSVDVSTIAKTMNAKLLER